MRSLRSVYKNVADIDLFVGGLMENKLAGGLLGPTFSCIIVDQVLVDTDIYYIPLKTI